MTKVGLLPDLDNCRFGPVTVFAPQNKNFLALIRELGITAEELLESKELKTILLNHAVAGEVFAEDLSDDLCVESLAGFELCFEINRDGVFVNGIEIVAVDIEACNGVVHVIDGVLLPPTPAAPTRSAPLEGRRD